MAKPTAGHQWQKQANHFQAIIVECDATIADPASTPEEVADATQTKADMEKNLARLLSKYGVSPTA